MSIESQKKLASEILGKLYLVSPSCILAGGAPRDWIMGNGAKDLDIYFNSSAVTAWQTRKQLCTLYGKDLTFDKNHLEWQQNGMYRTMKSLKRIYYCHYKGFPVQFIELLTPSDTYKVVKSMSVSICQAWWKSDKINGVSQDFKLTMQSRVMFLNEGYQWDDPHPIKMVERFKSKFTKGNKQDAKDKIVAEVLRGE